MAQPISRCARTTGSGLLPVPVPAPVRSSPGSAPGIGRPEPFANIPRNRFSSAARACRMTSKFATLVPPRTPTGKQRPAPEQRLRSRSRYRYPPSHRPTAPQRSGRQGPGAAGWKEHARLTPARSRSCRHHTKNGHLYRWPLYVSRTRGRESDGENSGTRSSDEPKKGTFSSPKKKKKGRRRTQDIL